MSDSAEIIRMAFSLIFFGSAPALVTAALAGLIVGLLQSITQIQDQSIAYVIKMIAVCAVLLLSAHWLLGHITKIFQMIFEQVPYLTGVEP